MFAPEGPRALFIYYRISADAAPSVHQTMASFQAELLASDADWRAQLWARTDQVNAPEVTFMEAYAHLEGITPARQAWLSAAIEALGLPAGITRHTEAFQHLGGSPCV